jgi:nicotinate-nucleotide adenylyltransferase
MDIDPRLSDAESRRQVATRSPRSLAESLRAPITPLDTPRGATILICGGTFDPPHRWHFRGPLDAMGHQSDPYLVVVPAARNPLKSTGPIASDEDRVAMVRLALETAVAQHRYHIRAVVWTDEIDRAKWATEHGVEPAPSFSVDTMRRLKAIRSPGVNLRLIIGVDQALAFHTWREWRELYDNAEPIVLPRNGVATKDEFADAMMATGAWHEDAMPFWKNDFFEFVPLEPVSSTQIRQALERGEPTPDLDPSVRAYIDERGLYR